VHTSFFVRAFPSLHEVPSAFGLQAVWLALDKHCWHWSAGLGSPAVKHAPAITQLPAVGTNVQVPSTLQLSAVHARPSSQVCAVPAHDPAVHTSFVVHAFASLHDAPSGFRLHAVWLVPGVHTWHWFAGFASPSAWQEPSITQLPGFGE